MNITRFNIVLICSLLIGGTAYGQDSVSAKIQVECSGRSGAQVAMRWGHPGYNQDEYMPLFTTPCGVGPRTTNLKILDRNSEFEVQTEGGVETSYMIKISLSDGSFIQLIHANSSDVTTRPVSLPLRTTGSLVPTFLFGDVLGTQQVAVNVTFFGALITPKGATGLDHFQASNSRTLEPGIIRQGVSIQVDNLRTGTWSITAQPNGVAGTVQCNFEIPATTSFMTIYPENPPGQQCR